MLLLIHSMIYLTWPFCRLSLFPFEKCFFLLPLREEKKHAGERVVLFCLIMELLSRLAWDNFSVLIPHFSSLSRKRGYLQRREKACVSCFGRLLVKKFSLWSNWIYILHLKSSVKLYTNWCTSFKAVVHCIKISIRSSYVCQRYDSCVHFCILKRENVSLEVYCIDPQKYTYTCTMLSKHPGAPNPKIPPRKIKKSNEFRTKLGLILISLIAIHMR